MAMATANIAVEISWEPRLTPIGLTLPIAQLAGKLDDDGKRLPMNVTKGDTVLIGKYTGQDIKINDEEHTIVREDEILGIIEK